jgi:hypothetical protein
MQNKPNFRSNKMNTTFLLTKDYEQITMNSEPIKTNPIKPNFIRLRRFQKAHLLGQAGQAVK